MNLVQLRPRLQMDTDTHRYYLDGHRVPGVNEVNDSILRSFSCDLSGTPREFDPAKRYTGTYVHKLCELDALDNLDVDTVDPEFAPWYACWLRFRREQSPTFHRVEFGVYNEKFRYAGTLDLVMKFAWRGRVGLYLCDIKTGTGSPFSKLQTAAYREAYHLSRDDDSFLESTRFILRLRPDTDRMYDLIPHTDLDLPYFHNAVSAWWWCYNNYNTRREQITDEGSTRNPEPDR